MEGVMSEASRQIVCPHCDGVNRVPRDRPALQAKCGRCHKPLFTGQPLAASAQSFGKHVGNSDIPVVVDFWAAWCGPCRTMAPVYERAAAEFEPEIRFLKLDTEAAPEVAGRYNIRGIPTLILFRNGAPVDQRVGALDGAALRAWLRPHTAQPSAA
jgi:thioredoxin 2